MESSAARMIRRLEITHPKTTSNTKPKSQEITIEDARGKIDELRTVNNDIFKGVHYSREYYDDVTSIGSFSRVAYVGDELAGAICCFIVTKGKDQYKRREINISTIGVFKHFRRRGIGTRLITNVTDAAIADSSVTKILLNVHSNDIMAMGFYKKLGFQVVNQIKLTHGSSWVMELTLRTIGLDGRWGVSHRAKVP